MVLIVAVPPVASRSMASIWLSRSSSTCDGFKVCLFDGFYMCGFYVACAIATACRFACSLASMFGVSVASKYGFDASSNSLASMCFFILAAHGRQL